MKACPGLTVQVFPIENQYFGPLITVSGLITGTDLIHALSGKELGEALLLPENMLRSGETVFLDDITLEEVQAALQTRIYMVTSSGQAFVSALMGVDSPDVAERFRPYEIKENLNE